MRADHTLTYWCTTAMTSALDDVRGGKCLRACVMSFQVS
jgi:hypothetical protein